jgi:hypothetical protein
MSPSSALQKDSPCRSESGQAIVEYILILALALSLVSVIAIGLRKSMFSLWKFMATDITAPCPGCKNPNGALGGGN